jgi:hypothetical protein
MFTFLPSCSHVHIARQNTYSYEQTTNEALTCLTSCLYAQSSRWLNVSKDILTNSLSTNNLKIILEVLVMLSVDHDISQLSIVNLNFEAPNLSAKYYTGN